MNFYKIKIEDRKKFREYLLSNEGFYKDFLGSETSFENLFIWSKDENIQISVDNDAIYVRADLGKGVFYLPPIVKDTANFIPCINKLYFYHKQKESSAFKIKAMPTYMLDYIEKSGGFEFIMRTAFDRDNSDYIYLTESFSTFKGKKLHSKRNHINNFLKKYDYTIKEYNKELRKDIDDILDRWVENGSIFDDGEKYALNKALDNFEELELKGIIVYVLDKPVAFEIGFKTIFNVGFCFFEKADIEYDGVFSFISNYFVKTCLRDTKYINRQEDMGMEGLRKSKLSYNPIFLFNKYTIEED